MLLRVIRLFIACAVVAVLPTARTEAAGLCPDAGGTQFVVDTAADAAQVAGGYVNKACDLIIRTKVASTVQNLIIIAKRISVEGPDAVSGGRVEIINELSEGRAQLTASNGNITVDQAEIKAANRIYINCKTVGCGISVADSAIVSSTDLSIGGKSGNIVLLAYGDVVVIDTPLYAGALLSLHSYRGVVTFKCEVADCDGVVPESLHIIAKGDITLGPVHVGGTLRGLSYSGRLLAAGTTVEAHNVEMNLGGAGVDATVQLASTHVTAGGTVRITTRGCPASGVCIDATNAEIRARGGTRAPCLNGRCAPPYAHVLDTDAECPGTGAATIEPAQIIMKAAGGSGTISLCGATLGGS